MPDAGKNAAAMPNSPNSPVFGGMNGLKLFQSM